jgi:signal transduction histidine kinase/CheY-like chemotaxis protein
MLPEHLTLPLDLTVLALGTAVCAWATFRGVRRWEPELLPGVLVVLLCAAIVATAGLAADWAGAREGRRIAQMLMAFAPSYAQQCEQAGITDIDLSTAPTDPTYLGLIEAQKRWLAVNPSAADIYTFVRDEAGGVRLLVDSETDYDGDGLFIGAREQRTPIGEPYPDAEPDLERAFAGEIVFADEPVTDRWGTWVSAYAPLRSPDGRVFGVLGVDYDATDWVEAIAARRLGVLAVAAFLVLVVLAAGSIVVVVRADAQRRELARRLLEEKTEALERSNRELAGKSEALQVANAAARAATRAKSQFLANVSHEIRTPLTAILGFAELLLDEERDPADRRDDARTIQRSGQHLLTILNDILDLSKIEAGRLELQPVPCRLAELAAEVVEMMRLRAGSKGLEIRLAVAPEVPEVISSDPTRLRQMLFNLVGNAVKFTSRGEVLVGLSADEREVRLEVRDTGIGMSADQIERLFRPFTQVDDSATRQHGGTGLGLTITRRLAEMMGGTIAVRSEPGLGSSFEVRLPRLSPAGPAERLPPPATATAAGPDEAGPLSGRVLVVDDGADNRRLLGHLLGRFGLEVEFEDNGAAAVERLEDPDRSPVDLVLMDMMMPDLDGHAATRQLRARGFDRPIVAVTAQALDGERNRCLDSGCDDYLTKPLDRRRLREVVERWLGRPRSAADPTPAASGAGTVDGQAGRRSAMLGA